MNPTAFLSPELENLIRVAWIVLIPVGVLLVIVLCKLMFILHSVSEFMTLARYEISPALRELRQTADHIEVLSGKMVTGVESLEKGVRTASPAVVQGVACIKVVTHDLRTGVGAVLGGIRNSFAQGKPRR